MSTVYSVNDKRSNLSLIPVEICSQVVTIRLTVTLMP